MVSFADCGRKVSMSPYCGHFFQLHPHTHTQNELVVGSDWELTKSVSNLDESRRLLFQVLELKLRCKSKFSEVLMKNQVTDRIGPPCSYVCC